ncbi:MAG: hypothetical protein AYK18_12540 [Theionarchaea archaeon DG-70]|nr:MAG: hypothetical protein AYK18_12540 [Theionarchaea archaeon DG-70]
MHVPRCPVEDSVGFMRTAGTLLRNWYIITKQNIFLALLYIQDQLVLPQPTQAPHLGKPL